MGHHHLLPFLVLTLLILVLQSSSITGQLQTTQALFSFPSQFLAGGENLTDGNVDLALSNDCGLVLYEDGEVLVDFNTSTKSSSCLLRLSWLGQLVLEADDEQVPDQAICNSSGLGIYALLFVKGRLGIFGSAIWSNDIMPKTTLGHGKLKKGVSDNFLVSIGRVDGNANGDVPIANNGDVSAYITPNCTLLVKDDADGTTIWETSPPTAEPKGCFLSLSDVGELLLQYREGSQLITQWTGGDFVGYNTYVATLRYFGRINIYGLKDYLYNCSASVAADAAAAVDAKNIKMVTA